MGLTPYEGWAQVEASDKPFYLDKKGLLIVKLQFDRVENFSEGLAAVSSGGVQLDPRESELSGGKWGFYTGGFSEGLARVMVGDKFGYVDKTGNLVIKPQFYRAAAFSNGLALVGASDNELGYINKTGQIVIPMKFDSAEDFSEGLARIGINGKWGYIDKMGKIVIQPQFDSQIQFDSRNSAATFSEGLAVVKSGDKYGYINKMGKVVIKPQFDQAGSFSDGLAQVTTGNKWGYIDKTGKLVIQPQVEAYIDFGQP